MNGSSSGQGLLRLVGALCALVAAAGCTTMTVPVFPDTGVRPDAGVVADAGPPARDAQLPPPTLETCTPEGMGSTLGETCAAASRCDDGCFCNGIEQCVDGVCVAGTDPCADDVDCTADACLEEANRCFNDPRHLLCSNSDSCDGAELCDATLGCVPGTPPYCNDDSSCTVDSCDAAMGCTYVLRDLDGDSFVDGRCGGLDCDDDPRFGRDIYPGAAEECMNRRDDDCDGMRDFNDTDCVPTNDDCASAVILPGPGTYSGSTAGLRSNYTLSCRSAGPDAVFRFALAEDSDVQVTVAGGGFGAGVALRPWALCSSGPDDKCNQASPPSFLRRSLPAGEYAIIVQSSSGAAFDLNLRFSDPTPVPPIDVCSEGTFDLCDGSPCGNVTRTVTGMYAETEDDYVLSCGPGPGRRDAAYRFTIDSPKDVSFSATAGSRVTYLALTTDCASTGAELNCTSSGWSSPAAYSRRELPPGTYYLLIESDDEAASSWSMNVSITDPAPRTRGDACSSPIDVSEATPGGGGTGTVDASRLELDAGTACGGATIGYRDATFVFTLAETRDLTVTTTVSGFGTYYAALQRACGDSGSDLRCWSGSGMVGQSWRSLPAGTYFLTIATNSTSGPVTASIRTGAPTAIPPNDRCDGAIELTSGSSRRDTTVGFSDDARGGTCAATGYPDAFYVVTLAERRRLLVTVSDADGGTDVFYLTLRATCGGSTTTALACQSGGPATISQTLDAGTYYLMVESTTSRMSDYNIDAFLLAP